MRWPARIVAALITVLLLVFTFVPSFAAIPPGTPGGTICRATLGKIGCAAFQKMLSERCVYVKVISGHLYGTVNSLKRRTYLAVLECVNSEDFICIITIKVTDKKAQIVDIQFTDRRQLQT